MIIDLQAHTQLSLFIIAYIYTCLGLMTWDLIVYQGIVPGEDGSWLSAAIVRL